MVAVDDSARGGLATFRSVKQASGIDNGYLWLTVLLIDGFTLDIAGAGRRRCEKVRTYR